MLNNKVDFNFIFIQIRILMFDSKVNTDLCYTSPRDYKYLYQILECC